MARDDRRAGLIVVASLAGMMGCTILLGENRSFHEVDGSGGATTGSSSAGLGGSSSVGPAGSSSAGPVGSSSGRPASTPAFVQGSSTVPPSAQMTVTATYPSPQTAGHTNVVAIGWSDVTNLVSVVDSRGNTYEVAMPTYTANYLSQAVWYAPNVAAGANTVTVSFDAPTAYPDLRVLEYSGLHDAAPFDEGMQATGAAPPAATPALTTTVPNELLFVAGMAYDMFSDVGPGFTPRVFTSGGDIAADAVAASPGSYAAMPTIVGHSWLLQLVAFKPGP
jgi:hypothetical protein